MKCKCCKCYKEIEEKDQVKDEHAIWCQTCHYKSRVIGWVIGGVLIAVVVVVIIWILWTNKNEEK